MNCPLCKREIPTNGTDPSRTNFCVFCGSPLLKMTEEMTALVGYLTEKGIISSPDDLTRTVSITFRYTTDDGLVPMKQFDRPLVCPLYYTADDVMDALIRSKMLYRRSFHSITEFYGYSSDLQVNHREDYEKRPAGQKTILAEALTMTKDNRLTLVYARRAEMISRAGPNMCLYGCPASSELESRYAGVKQRTELLPLDE